MIYAKTDKRRLYWLINLYRSKRIDMNTFCDEFYFCYAHELDRNTLDIKEKYIFSELHKIVVRFSPFEEDHRLAPKAYFTQEDVNNEVEKAYKALQAAGKRPEQYL